MGCFSSGNEGLDYQGKWCFRCQHWPDDANDGNCAVWAMHQLYNYEQYSTNSKNKLIKRFLQMLIPEDKNGNNEKCLMFIEREGELPGQKHFEI